jgi:predicted secreted acid phosphatase
MNNTRFVTNIFFVILCSALISTKSMAEPTNIHSLRSALRGYHDSGVYLKEITHVANTADKYITKQANLNQHSVHPKKLAIVLDIDETSLSYYKHLARHHFCYDPIASRDEILKANAPAIEPILNLYQNAIKHDVSVFFITARRSYAYQATMRNLKVAGYKKWEGIFTKPQSYKKRSMTEFKSGTREILTKQGYTIIASIGDQQSDLKGGYALKTFKIPNPYYHIA